MTGPEKLTDWMKNRVALSNRELAIELEKKMLPDFPNGFGVGNKIHPSDISEARNGKTAKKFKKVTSAIIKYFNLPEGFFGEYEKPGAALLSSVREAQHEYLTKNNELRDRLLAAHDEIHAVRKENQELMRLNFEQEKELIGLRNRVRELEEKG